MKSISFGMFRILEPVLKRIVLEYIAVNEQFCFLLSKDMEREQKILIYIYR